MSAYLTGSNDTLLVLADVRDERVRQEEIGRRKRAEGIDWRSCADPDMVGGDLMRLAVLGEELGEAALAHLTHRYGEVARAVLEAGYGGEEGTEAHLRTELVQVAAVAVVEADRFKRDAEWARRELAELQATGVGRADRRSALIGRIVMELEQRSWAGSNIDVADVVSAIVDVEKHHRLARQARQELHWLVDEARRMASPLARVAEDLERLAKDETPAIGGGG